MKYSLNEVGLLEFDLDHETTFENSNTLVVSREGRDFLLGFDANQGHLNYYDLEKGSFEFKQVVEKGDGPNSIVMPMSLDFISSDSILVYGYSQGLYLLDRNSIVTNSFNAGAFDDKGTPGEALILGTSPIKHLNHKVYFSSFTRGVSDNSLHSYDLETGVSESMVPYPEGYNGLLISYYNVWNSVNEEQKQSLTSFSLEDSVHVYDISTGVVNKIYAGSQWFKKPSRSQIVNTLSATSTAEDIQKATITFHENTQYGPIIYNKSENVYHRLCFLPLLRDGLQGGSYFRDFSIITFSIEGEILAEDVIENEVGEYFIMYPEAVWFTNNGSLYIQKVNESNEDQLLYKEFKLRKNE